MIFQNLNMCPEDESVILSSFYNNIASLSVKQGKHSILYTTEFEESYDTV